MNAKDEMIKNKTIKTILDFIEKMELKEENFSEIRKIILDEINDLMRILLNENE